MNPELFTDMVVFSVLFVCAFLAGIAVAARVWFVLGWRARERRLLEDRQARWRTDWNEEGQREN